MNGFASAEAKYRHFLSCTLEDSNQLHTFTHVEVWCREKIHMSTSVYCVCILGIAISNQVKKEEPISDLWVRSVLYISSDAMLAQAALQRV